MRTATDAAAALATGETTSTELVQACLDRIAAVDGQVGAFLGTAASTALAEAKAADARRATGQARSPLDGVPIALKNLIAVQGQPLTAASRILGNFTSPYDAHVVEQLKAAGVVILGRLNMDEFAMGSSTENSALGTTRNPWDLDRVPGGSSGGSAAAVAAGEVPLTLGTDTGGSIRQPAAFCGVVGVKPTYGRVSRYGAVAFASSLDQIGPLAQTTEDAAHLLQIIAGHDARDSTSLPAEVPDYVAALKATPTPFRLGLPKEYFEIDGLDPAVRAAVDAAKDWYASHGAEIVEVSLPHTELAVPVYYVLATAEASSNLARYDGIRYGHRAAEAKDGIDLYFQSRGEGFGDEVKRRIILGTFVLSAGYVDAYYKRAQQVRTLLRSDFEQAFTQCDALLTPTTPTPAFKFGEKSDDPLQMYLADIFTLSASLAGLPAISLPCGFSQDGLPLGMQLIGPALAEGKLLQLGHQYEQAHAWHQRTAAL